LSLAIIDVLGNCRMFSQVQHPGFNRLVAIAKLCEFRKGEIIFWQGQECPGMYIVGSGLVRVFKTAPNGKEHILHLVGPGHTFAEVAAIGGFDCPANAEAIAPTTCVLLPMAPLKRLLEQDHPLCLQVMTGLTLWVRHLVSLMEDIVLRDATGRMVRYLLESEPGSDGTIELPTLKRHLASHLNVTSETFSRVLGRLIETGLVVELDGNRLQLLDRQRLRQMRDEC
jgi:CRP/FNR family transcriptional regulator